MSYEQEAKEKIKKCENRYVELNLKDNMLVESFKIYGKASDFKKRS